MAVHVSCWQTHIPFGHLFQRLFFHVICFALIRGIIRAKDATVQSYGSCWGCLQLHHVTRRVTGKRHHNDNVSVYISIIPTYPYITPYIFSTALVLHGFVGLSVGFARRGAANFKSIEELAASLEASFREFGKMVIRCGDHCLGSLESILWSGDRRLPWRLMQSVYLSMLFLGYATTTLHLSSILC